MEGGREGGPGSLAERGLPPQQGDCRAAVIPQSTPRGLKETRRSGLGIQVLLLPRPRSPGT